MPVVVVGAGPVGLATAAMFARRGVDTIVFDRDPEPPPTEISDSWERWNRPGVAQFRQAHLLMALGRAVLADEIPEAIQRLRESGAYTVNPAHFPPPTLSDWEPSPDDSRFEMVNARRPLIDAAIATTVSELENVEVRRGVAVDSLVAGADATPGTPHVVGVRTSQGDVVTADLVVDAMGRRSRMPELLEELGANRPGEEAEDNRFAYYTQFYRMGENGPPQPFAPGLHPLGSISILVIPADAGSWSVTVYASSNDKAMRALRDPEVHQKLVRAHPGFETWTNGERDGDVNVMAGVVDRQRFYVTGGVPVATGVIPVGDGWACTNPSLGRGISLGLKQAALSVEAAAALLDDPGQVVLECDRVTREIMEPWHNSTLRQDRARSQEIQDLIDGKEPAPASQIAAVMRAAAYDTVVFRQVLEVGGLFMTESDALGDEEIRTRVNNAAGKAPERPRRHPTRAELLELVT